MRSPRVFAAVRRAIAQAGGAHFRVVHFSVQQDHIHLIVEADSRMALGSGLRRLAIRTALAVNRAAGRRGRVWGDRYHARALKTPREIRASIGYVLLNFRKHLRAAPGVDPFSSGAYFSGWRRPPPIPTEVAPVGSPSTWLARVGWMRAGGLLRTDEGPTRAR